MVCQNFKITVMSTTDRNIKQPLSASPHADRGSLRESPFKVPDDYFASFKSRMMESLPEYPAKVQPTVPRSFWGKIKPYVYLAAMFAGIWCMMQMFHMASASQSYSIDNPPEAVVLALNDDDTYEFFSEAYLPAPEEVVDAEDQGIIEEVSGMYDDMESLEKDLGITLSPKYENMEI